MRVLLTAVAAILSTSAVAQTPNPLPTTEQYYLQMIANKESQSSKQIVDMAKQLDELKAELGREQAEIANLKKKLEAKPDSKQ